ncbi:MAG: hypothetical protein LPK03_13730 [Pontibacter sp.]|nr:hypothetical protein [Pontibacter sp.]
MPVGDGKVSYIDTRDIAAVAVEVLLSDEHKGKVYELTGPEALSHHEMAALLGETTGKQVDFVDVPEEAAREAMMSYHTPSSIADALLELYAAYKSGKSAMVTEAVQQVTGRPPHSFRQFAKDYQECF